MPQKHKLQDDPPEPAPHHLLPPPGQPAAARRTTRHTPVQPPPIPSHPYQYFAPPAQKPAQQAPAPSQTHQAAETGQHSQRRTRSQHSQPQLASLARLALQASSFPNLSWSPPPEPNGQPPAPPRATANTKTTAAAVAAPRTTTSTAPRTSTTTTSVSRPAPAMAATAPPVRNVTAPAPTSARLQSQSTRPAGNLVAPEITYHIPQAHSSSHRRSALVRPHGPTAPPPRLQPMTVTPVYPPKPPALGHPLQPAPQPSPGQKAAAERLPPRPDRNIDKVVLGNICFRTWYPSYYGKEVLGDSTGNSGKSGSKDAGGKDQTGGKAASRKDREPPPVLERLYVCPCCFKYSKELVAWWGHVRVCERQAHVPGRKVYIHPRGRRKVVMPHTGKIPAPGAKKRRGEGGVKYIEEIVQDEGEWSVWEVDGEEDPLFCQNLSLFAKLFLDNKSVFFDVAGFNYFLLVYTPPPPKTPPAPSEPPSRPQITGFFSKEKLSWDNNNLACILVFPPWQRKGLGALLMGVSYEISRREGLLGGPEKPISDLGRKGYKRFWAGEIARWLLQLDLDAAREGKEAALVDVNDCSRATWIHPDDCLLVLRDMEVVEEAGMGPGKPPKTDGVPAAEKETTPTTAATEKKDEEATAVAGGEEVHKEVKLIPRVRVDKQAVRRYVSEHRISLERTCDADGFTEGYAMKVAEADDSGEEGREKDTE